MSHLGALRSGLLQPTWRPLARCHRPSVTGRALHTPATWRRPVQPPCTAAATYRRPAAPAGLPSAATVGANLLSPVPHPQPSRPMSTEATGSPDLMDFPHILFPSFIKMMKNVFLTWFVIRPYLDHNFSLQSFIEGAKEALIVISDRMANGDLAGLQGLVTPEALEELKRNYSALTVRQRCELKVEREHIGPIFPYEIGMIIEEEGEVQKRWVEITVCAHVHANFQYKERLSERQYTPPYHMADLTICNYRFIRNYTRGVRDSWTVNVVNHFRPNQPASSGR